MLGVDVFVALSLKRGSKMFKIKIGKKLKEWNKDMIPRFEKIEKLEFETEKKAENYGLETLGGGVMWGNKEISAEVFEEKEGNKQ